VAGVNQHRGAAPPSRVRAGDQLDEGQFRAELAQIIYEKPIYPKNRYLKKIPAQARRLQART